MRRIRLFVAAMSLLCAPAAAWAQNCANFGDLQTSSPFCPDVEWVKNRAITLGCGTGANYCPGDPVTRLAMAAFLHRLGVALTPVDLAPVGANMGVLTPATNPVVCATADFAVPAVSFPRRAYVNGMATISSPSANIDVRAHIVYSTNGGGTWTMVGNSDQYATVYGGGTPADQATLAPFGSVDLNVGQTIRFAVELRQAAGSGTVNVTCSLRAQVANRNAATSPLDTVPAVAAERPRGG